MRIDDILGWIRIRIRGSMPLTNGSGSCYFRHWPSRCQLNKFFYTIFSAYYFLKLHLHHLSKIKSQKETQNSRNQGFSYYFCGSGSRAGSGSGSIHLTSGSGRPKNMWIRWIRIRIRNTAYKEIIPDLCNDSYKEIIPDLCTDSYKKVVPGLCNDSSEEIISDL